MGIVCQVCGVEGYLQHIGKNYYRVRHYVRLDSSSRKPIFTYHQQSVEYVKSKIDQLTIDQSRVFIDPKRLKSDSVEEIEEGRSSSLVGHLLDVQKVAGSIPARPTTTQSHYLKCS